MLSRYQKRVLNRCRRAIANDGGTGKKRKPVSVETDRIRGIGIGNDGGTGKKRKPQSTQRTAENPRESLRALCVLCG